MSCQFLLKDPRIYSMLFLFKFMSNDEKDLEIEITKMLFHLHVRLKLI